MTFIKPGDYTMNKEPLRKVEIEHAVTTGFLFGVGIFFAFALLGSLVGVVVAAVMHVL